MCRKPEKRRAEPPGEVPLDLDDYLAWLREQQVAAEAEAAEVRARRVNIVEATLLGRRSGPRAPQRGRHAPEETGDHE